MKKFSYSSCTNDLKQVSKCYIIGEYMIFLNKAKQNIQVSVELNFLKFGNNGTFKTTHNKLPKKSNLSKMVSNWVSLLVFETLDFSVFKYINRKKTYAKA